MKAQFVHLRLHTEFSLVDSVVRVPELLAATVAAGMPAVAVTDQNNLFAMVKFYREALNQGIKPIVGVDLLLAETAERRGSSRLTLLCQNQEGYRNVTRLVTRAYLEGQKNGPPMVERSWLTAQSLTGLIGLSGGAAGDIGCALLNGRPQDARSQLDFWRGLFGDRFYIELQRLGRRDEESYIAAAVELAAARGVPLVATNDVRFLGAADFETHEARVCIQGGHLLTDPARPRLYSAQQFLRTPQQMCELFADLPEATANSVQIARRCNLVLNLGQARLPDYPVPAGMSTEQFLQSEALNGLAARVALTHAGVAPQGYRERLDLELKIICQMGFAGYFLIVADFIRWARDNAVPVGPGRGSGAGSLVAYALCITDLDPLQHGLLFERFLNPERVSMPDFDVDFCMDGRDRVIDYVAQKYGRDRVSQIITYGTMAAKAVVRDVGRVLGLSYGFVDRIAKLVPFELGITLDDALTKEPELKRLYDSEDEIRNLIDLARALEGLTRNAGTHAGGVVIAPSVLTDFAPLYCEAGSNSVVTQFDKDDVEAAGLVKFDFLGLRTLTIIDRTLAIINQARAADATAFSLQGMPVGDAATYALLKSGRTTAVFQLESRGMRDLIRKLKPDCFEDIVALVALFRPGPLESGMVDDFISRKREPAGGVIDYLHPDLKPALAETYGVILYQEQVMKIAQVLAGYTLGGADLLRKAMGKKKPEEMAKQRSIFVSGAVARGVPEQQAAHIFDLMEKFAGYGFNKSHSAAYAVLSYQTAYLKTHHTAAFMAAVLSADMDHTDKVVTLIDECKQLALAVLPPDVNASRYEFAVADAKTIRYGLGAVKGVGQGAVEALIAEREARGPYRTLDELCRRTDLTRINRRTLEALIRSGSLDSLGANRATLLEGLPSAMQLGDQNARAHEAGQNDMFGLSAVPEPAAQARAALRTVADFSEAVRLQGERETLGLYLTGHPIDRFEADLPRFAAQRIGELISERPASSGEGERGFSRGRLVTVAGLIDEIRKRGQRISVILDDRTGRIEVTLFEEVFQRHRELIVKDAIVLVEGHFRFDEFGDAWRIAARKLTDLNAVREQQARRLVLKLPQRSDRNAMLTRLAEVLTPWRNGPCQVTVQYWSAQASGALDLGPEWNVRPGRELLEHLEELVGREGMRVLYGPVGAPGGP
ncbi:MAG TPA: DNA polymerase III subunit alpha [Steroidobacteraceae bacterium]|jgi:DNA polymerase-3 subunit alpha|nr:DNA polymerase III subunit alpha [Steroidobacteraceae bacterium]